MRFRSGAAPGFRRRPATCERKTRPASRARERPGVKSCCESQLLLPEILQRQHFSGCHVHQVPKAGVFVAVASMKVEIPAAEQTEQPDDDQVDRDDVIQEARNGENQYAGDERDERRNTEVHLHENSPVFYQFNADRLPWTVRYRTSGGRNRLTRARTRCCVRLRTDPAAVRR